jgi:pimeloyl-ACP methyl ester carboxylesterase
MHRTQPTTRRLLAGVLALLAAGTAAADVVILKDGFPLQGRLKREFTSSDGLIMGKINGSFMMDEGTKWTYFSHRQVRPDGISDEDVRDGEVKLIRTGYIGERPLPVAASFSRVTPFDAKWERTLYVRETEKTPETPIRQRLMVLTPHFARILGVEHRWSVSLSTQELGFETVSKLLDTHPDTKEEPGKPDLDRRLRRFRFYAQAEWFDKADKELDRILADLPDSKEKVDEARKALRGARGLKVLEEVERAQAAGRFRGAEDLFKLVGKPEELPEKVVGRYNELKVKAETAAATTRSARELLAALVPMTAAGADAALFRDAARAIEEGLTPETAGRLELFVTLAEQAEADRKKGKPAAQSAEELLSLAVTGWLLGRNASEAKVSTARKLWKARQFCLGYLREEGEAARAGLLEKYQKEPDVAEVGEITQLIPTLPPVDPAELSPGKMSQQHTAPSGVKYTVRVPPEYTHHRPYPVIVALHHTTQKASELADGMSLDAARNGYIVVAPEWTDGFQQTFDYTSEEHTRVLDVVRDMRRRYQVDSDRVFLFGFGEGGTAACDIALSHPDLFAGLVPMGTGYSWSIGLHYWHNARNLPVYMITGEMAGSAPKWLKKVFDEWHPQGFPALLVMEKGRGMEWFGAEMPAAYDWMNRQKRVFPARALGNPGGVSDGSYRSLRSIDNRFYWLSSSAARNLSKSMPPKGEVVPARFGATVFDGNRINVSVLNVNQVTVWLAPAQVDFSKPVSVTVDGNVRGSVNKLLPPSLAVLLEDLADRGDRQQLFWARVDFGK